MKTEANWLVFQTYLLKKSKSNWFSIILDRFAIFYIGLYLNNPNRRCLDNSKLCHDATAICHTRRMFSDTITGSLRLGRRAVNSGKNLPFFVAKLHHEHQAPSSPTLLVSLLETTTMYCIIASPRIVFWVAVTRTAMETSLVALWYGAMPPCKGRVCSV